MIDLNSLNVGGGALFAAASYFAASVLLGGEVANRTLEQSGWFERCEAAIVAGVDRERSSRSGKIGLPSCEELVGSFDPASGYHFCANGGGLIWDVLTYDPTAGARAKARELELQKLQRVAANAPTQCSCAAEVMTSDRSWWVYAGSLRLTDALSLEPALSKALHGVCAITLEG